MTKNKKQQEQQARQQKGETKEGEAEEKEEKASQGPIAFEREKEKVRERERRAVVFANACDVSKGWFLEIRWRGKIETGSCTRKQEDVGACETVRDEHDTLHFKGECNIIDDIQEMC